MSYVPMQDAAAPAYEPSEALARGTLFPGLDLPFMNSVNESAPDVPTAERDAVRGRRYSTGFTTRTATCVPNTTI